MEPTSSCKHFKGCFLFSPMQVLNRLNSYKGFCICMTWLFISDIVHCVRSMFNLGAMKTGQKNKGYNLGKNIWSKVKKSNKTRKKQKNFDNCFCFCLIFDCCYKNFTSGRKTGQWALFPPTLNPFAFHLLYSTCGLLKQTHNSDWMCLVSFHWFDDYYVFLDNSH